MTTQDNSNPQSMPPPPPTPHQLLKALSTAVASNENGFGPMTEPITCPGLSMWHEGGHHNAASRKDAQQHAVQLLSRQVSMPPKQLSSLLLTNLYSSFATLVESRLYAYASFLARHNAMTHSSRIEQRILMILTLGANVELAGPLTSNFEPTTKDEEGAFAFETTFNLNLPRQTEVSVKVETAGSLSEHQSCGYQISLDIPRLLQSMINQASRVVSAVVELAAKSSELGVKAESSFTLRKRNYGLELLCQAADQLPVVSPNVSSSKPPVLAIPSLNLESDVDNLSADQCANIVDTCLIEEEREEQPTKRQRL